MKRWKVYGCAAVFLLLTAVKMIAPAAASDARAVLVPAIGADDDYRAVFAEIRSAFSTARVGEQDVRLQPYLPEVDMSAWATPAPEPTPTPTPQPTPEPTPEPTPTPAPLLRDTITAEMLGYVYRPADEFWYDEAKTAAVIPYMLAVHYGPGMDWGENMALNMGDTVEILAKQNGWVLLRTADGRYGWAAGELLRETADAPAATATPAAPVNPADPAVPVAPATAAPTAAPTPDYTEVSNPDLK